MVVHDFHVLYTQHSLPVSVSKSATGHSPGYCTVRCDPLSGPPNDSQEEIEDSTARLRNLKHPIVSGQSSRLPRTSQHDAGPIDVPCPGKGNPQSHANGITRRVSIC